MMARNRFLEERTYFGLLQDWLQETISGSQAGQAWTVYARCCLISSYNKCSCDSAIYSQVDLASVRGYQKDFKSTWDCGCHGPSTLRQSLWGRLETQRSLRWGSSQAGNFSYNFQPSIHNWQTVPRGWFARYLYWIRDNRIRFSRSRLRRRCTIMQIEFTSAYTSVHLVASELKKSLSKMPSLKTKILLIFHLPKRCKHYDSTK